MTEFSHGEIEHPFYGKEILATREQEFIKQMLKKYQHEKVDEDLKKKIWDDLQQAKFLGKVTIPFKVVLRRDQSGKFPSFVEVILDTKV